MIITPQVGKKLGATVTGLDPRTASDQDFAALRDAIYSTKIVVLKNQSLSLAEFVALGRRLGRPEIYYQPMYHHPDQKEIFVSSNVNDDEKQIGVPKTGKFWHADYQFMANPFGLTLIYPQVVPMTSRGTYFIDMGEAYERLPDELKSAIVGTRVVQSVRRYFKIRPTDVYRPVTELLEEIEQETPAIQHSTTFKHPVTGETVLYISEGFTSAILDIWGQPMEGDILRKLLEATGQLDMTFQHENVHLQTFEAGDLLIWDNRSLIHRALHTTTPEPAVSYRVTVHDEYPFYEGVASLADSTAS